MTDLLRKGAWRRIVVGMVIEPHHNFSIYVSRSTYIGEVVINDEMLKPNNPRCELSMGRRRAS